MTSLRCDRATGHVTLDGHRLRLPTLREWCDWYDEHELVVMPVGSFDIEAAKLNSRIVDTLGGGRIDRLEPGFLPLGDSMLTAALLGFWRANPLDPWMPHTPQTQTKARNKRRPIRTDLTGGLGMRAVLYRALVQIASPREVDSMELPQIAMLLGVDDPDRDLEPDEDVEEGTNGGQFGPGARVTRNARGDAKVLSFRRHPTQPYLFSRPGNIHRRRSRP